MFRTSFRDGPSLQQRHRRAPLHTSVRFRPQVEALEDRTVASSTTLTVAPNPVTAGQAVTLAASATGIQNRSVFNRDWEVSVRFEFYADGALLGQQSQYVFSAVPRTSLSAQLAVSLPVGTHTLSVRLVNLFVPTDSSASAPVSLGVVHPPQTSLAGLIGVARGLSKFDAQKGRLLQRLTVTNASGAVQGGQGQFFLVLTGLHRKARVRAAGGAFQRAVGGRVAINLNLDQLAAGQQLNLLLEFRGMEPRQLKRVAASVVVGPL